MPTTHEKPRRTPNPARVFGRAEMDLLLSGSTSKIRRAVRYLKLRLSRTLGVQTRHDMLALDATLRAEISRRESISK